MKLAFLLTLFFLGVSIGVSSDRFECIKRVYDDHKDSSFVCVCNATYCDTIEPIDSLDSDQFQEYVTSKAMHRLTKFKRNFQVVHFEFG